MSKHRKITLYFPQWFFSANIGDSVMLSSLFQAVKTVYQPCFLEVVTTSTLIDTFSNDPYVDCFREPTKFERAVPIYWHRKRGGQSWNGHKKNNIKNWLLNFFTYHKRTGNLSFSIFPEWKYNTFLYLSAPRKLQECIDSSMKNILSYNFALQIGKEVAAFDDLRPRIWLTDNELLQAKQHIVSNSIAINIARIRNGQVRLDGEVHRYKLGSWKKFVEILKQFDPTLTVYEVGQSAFEHIGDVFLPNKTIRTTAMLLSGVKLVVLSDGGLHNICNAIEKQVLLFQAYEMNPPDLFKMGNALFSESYHCDCRKQCNIFPELTNRSSLNKTCSKECYNLNPVALAHDCIQLLTAHKN